VWLLDWMLRFVWLLSIVLNVALLLLCFIDKLERDLLEKVS